MDMKVETRTTSLDSESAQFGNLGRPMTEGEKLLLRVRITLKCRFNAAARLKRHAQCHRVAAMALTLGLIVIPLLQNSSIRLAFTTPIMHMMQVLLGVGVLVFTVAIGKGMYELRADRLNKEGDALKDMSRRLVRALTKDPNLRLDDFHHEYARLTLGKEGHSRLDYLKASLEMPDDVAGWSGSRLALRLILLGSTFGGYLVPVVLIVMEAAFVADMLGLTTLYPQVLHASATLAPLAP